MYTLTYAFPLDVDVTESESYTTVTHEGSVLRQCFELAWVKATPYLTEPIRDAKRWNFGKGKST